MKTTRVDNLMIKGEFLVRYSFNKDLERVVVVLIHDSASKYHLTQMQNLQIAVLYAAIAFFFIY